MDNPSLYSDKVFWQNLLGKIGTPFIFLVIFVLAAWGISKIQKLKSEFDTEMNAPLSVKDDKTDSVRSVKPIILSGVISGDFNKVGIKSDDGEMIVVKDDGEMIVVNDDGKMIRVEENNENEEKKVKLVEFKKDKTPPPDQKTQALIVKKSVSEIKYQEFKGIDDLTDALYLAVQRSKNDDLKYVRSNYDYLRKLEAENRFRQRLAQIQLQGKAEEKQPKSNKSEATQITGTEATHTDRTKEDTEKALNETVLRVEWLCPHFLKERRAMQKAGEQIAEKESPICEALLARKENDQFAITEKTGEMSYPNLKTVIDNYYTKQKPELIRNRQFSTGDINDDVGEIDKKYEPIIHNIYNFRKNDKAKDIFYKPPKPNVDRWIYAQMFDDKNGLSLIYKSLLIVGMAAMVFALMFLALTLVKRVFFLSPYAEAVTDQFKKLLERKDGSSSPTNGFGRTAIATVAAFGVGAAAITGTLPLNTKANSPSQEEPNKTVPAASTVLLPGEKAKYKPFVYNKTLKTDFDDNDLLASLADLKISIDLLEATIKENPPKSGNTIFEGDCLDCDETTNPPPINTKEITDAINLARASIVGVGNLISNAENPKGTVMDGLREISNLAVNANTQLSNLNITTGNIYNKADAIEGSVRNINANVGIIQSATDKIANTADSISNTAGKIEKNTDTITQQSARRSDVLTDNGKGLLTQIKSLFIGRRYFINEAKLLTIKTKFADVAGKLEAFKNQRVSGEVLLAVLSDVKLNPTQWSEIRTILKKK